MSYFLYFLFLCIFGAVFSLLFFPRVRAFSLAFFIFSSAFITRLFGIVANEYFGFFDAKLASSLPVINYATLTGDGTYWNGNFALQTVLNIPGFLIVDPNVYVLLMTNAFVGALAFLPLLYVMKKNDMENTGIILSLIVSFLPSAFNFSIFALRDVLLFSAVIWYCAAIIGLWYSRKIGISIVYFLISIASLSSIASMRIELFAFVLVPFFGFFFYRFFLVRSSDRLVARKNATTRVAFFGLIAILITALSVPSLYTIVVRQVNREGASPIELVEIAATQRFMRAASGGGGRSNIVDVATYQGLPWYARWSLQTVGLVITPFPWQVTNPARLLAFLDSLILIWMLAYVVIRRRSALLRDVSSPYFWFFITYVLGILIMGVVVVNAGNAFRMRLPLLPFLFIPFCVMYLQSKKASLDGRTKSKDLMERQSSIES